MIFASLNERYPIRLFRSDIETQKYICFYYSFTPVFRHKRYKTSVLSVPKFTENLY